MHRQGMETRIENHTSEHAIVDWDQQTVAVITGGGSGMGLETARRLGKKHILVLCGRSVAKLEQAVSELTALGMTVYPFACDVSNRQSVEELARFAARLGTVQAVVHAAGMSPNMGTAQAIMEANALGTIHMNNAFVDVIAEGGCMLDVSSMSAYITPAIIMPTWIYKESVNDPERFMKRIMKWVGLFPKKVQNGVAYGISKHFVIWFAKQDAARYGRRGARVLSVSPGNFDTPMGNLEKEEADADTKHCAIKRFGQVSEVASLFEYCVSKEAGYLTGTDILCDGGLVASGISPFKKVG